MGTSEEKAEPTAEDTIALRQANTQAFLLGGMPDVARTVDRAPSKFKLDNVLATQTIFTGADSVNAATLVSRMSNPPIISKFLEATPAQLSVLVPNIEFFYVLQDSEKKTLKSEPINFSDHSSGERIKFLSKNRHLIKDSEDFNKILKKTTNDADDVGVKEFTWMFDNKHEGNKTLKATLTLHFGSILDLLNDKYLRFIFNRNTAEEGVKDKESSQSLKEILTRFDKMQHAAVSAFRNKYSKEDQKDFRQIKVRVGWSKPERKPKKNNDKDGNELPTDVFAGMTATQTKEFYDAVEATQKIILLNLTQYKLNFGQQGQVGLTIDYVGSLDSVLSDPEKTNIFSRTHESNTNRTVPRALRYETGLGIRAPSQAEGTSFKDSAFGYKEGQKDKGSVTFANKQLMGSLANALHDAPVRDEVTFVNDSFITNLGALQYEQKTLLMLRQYLKENNDASNSKHEKLFEAIDDGLEAVRQAESILEKRLASLKYSQFMGALLNSGKIKTARIRPSILKANSVESAAAGAGGQLIVGQATSKQRKSKKKQFDKAMKNLSKKDAGVDEDKEGVLDPESTEKSGQTHKGLEVLFFTVGDLLDIATGGLNKRHEILESLDGNILLGGFSGYDAGIIGSKKRNMIFSVADIPISVDWFGQWFIDNFLGGNPPPNKISLRDFTNKLLNNMVAPLINEAFKNSNRTVGVNFSMTSIAYPRDEKVNLRSKSNHGRVTFDAIDEMVKSIVGAAPVNSPTTTYFPVFCTVKQSGTNKSLVGNKAQDQAKGIYHLTLGSDRGLVKTFSFSEKKMPQLRAINIENNNAGSALVLPQDVELTMVGNTFFRNGSVIYIDAGFALGNLVSKKLGIGGYYMVVKSENTINASIYETRLTCMFLQSPGAAG